jgi:hypothetical protein
LLQPPQSRAPKSFDIVGELVETFAPDHIVTLRSDPTLLKKPSLTQYCDVLGHGGSRQLEASCDATSRHLSRANKVHDLEPRLVAQCLNLCKDSQSSINLRQILFT